MPGVLILRGVTSVIVMLDSLEMDSTAQVNSRSDETHQSTLRISFSDVNECDLDLHICGSQLCVNTEGSYECTCDTGYIWNGTLCSGTL